MDFSIVVYIIIVIIVLYYLISWWSSDSTQLATIHGTSEQLTIPASKAGQSTGINCGYSIWINVANMNATIRNVFIRNDINMKLDVNNKLLLNVSRTSTLSTPSTLTPMIESSDSILIPMQKWVNIIISFETSYLTVFIDGKMVASKNIAGWSPVPSTTTIGGGSSFDGEIANFKFFNNYLTVRDAWNIYKEGYGSGFFSGLINKYNLKVAFLKDNSEVTSFKI
jgi:hypothetical protein